MPARTGIDLKPTNRDFDQQAKPLRRFRLDYLSAVETDENVVFRFVPRPCTTAMIATEMPAAMSPYSMAVAAVSSFKKEDKRFFIGNSFWSHAGPLVLR
jgi:hypothetical protein